MQEAVIIRAWVTEYHSTPLFQLKDDTVWNLNIFPAK